MSVVVWESDVYFQGKDVIEVRVTGPTLDGLTRSAGSRAGAWARANGRKIEESGSKRYSAGEGFTACVWARYMLVEQRIEISKIDLCESCVVLTGGDPQNLDPSEARRCWTGMRALWPHAEINPGSEDDGEGGYSSSACEGCGLDLAGQRYPGHAKEWVNVS